ncbi:GNAT family N-acetyltransferase [Sphingomonas sp. Leaf62]|uniref:GNAT family N-acetyltransferase n=1 Tax=Sphingomonas sp. Leaf62 TaxID=1736228 RepID=UPI000B120A85|nr:GNAT family N-acetyltransferase [Sphingomonas sp. Leaf62]
MTAQWRPARADDAPSIAALARAELGEYGEAADLYAERIALSAEGCWVLADDGTVVGHCISHPWHRLAPPAMHTLLGDLPPSADCWYLHDVVVAPVARGTRAVERLLPILDDIATRRAIPVLALIAVGGADAYWARQGFIAAPGGAAGFGADAVYMERPVACPVDGTRTSGGIATAHPNPTTR